MKKTLSLLLFICALLEAHSQNLTIVDGTNSVTILPTSLRTSRSLLSTNQNIAIGIGALSGNNGGNYNTAVGFNAGFGTTGSGNVFIGYNAGHSYTGNDHLIIRGRYGSNGLIYGNFADFRVGINTDSPQANMHINSPDSSTTFKLTNTATGTGIANGLIVEQNRHNVAMINQQPTGFLSFGTNSQGIMNITPTGKIGVNTVTPIGDFNIHSSISSPNFSSLRLSNDTSPSAGFYLNTHDANAYVINQSAGGLLYFLTEGRFSMAITDQNKVGIGTNVPVGKLEVMYNSDLSSAHLELNETQYDYARLRFKNTESNSTGQYWDIAATVDNLASSTPGDQLNFYLNGRGDIFQVRGDGSACLNGNLVTTGAACTSDIRYKKNFSRLANSLGRITQLKGFYYFWKTDEFKEKGFTANRQIGFIAQEVEKLFPELVMTDGKGYKSVDYARLTPVLVEAMKELQAKNDLLEERLNRIEKLLSDNTLQAKN